MALVRRSPFSRGVAGGPASAAGVHAPAGFTTILDTRTWAAVPPNATPDASGWHHNQIGTSDRANLSVVAGRQTGEQALRLALPAALGAGQAPSWLFYTPAASPLGIPMPAGRKKLYRAFWVRFSDSYRLRNDPQKWMFLRKQYRTFGDPNNTNDFDGWSPGDGFVDTIARRLYCGLQPDTASGLDPVNYRAADAANWLSSPRRWMLCESLWELETSHSPANGTARDWRDGVLEGNATGVRHGFTLDDAFTSLELQPIYGGGVSSPLDDMHIDLGAIYASVGA